MCLKMLGLKDQMLEVVKDPTIRDAITQLQEALDPAPEKVRPVAKAVVKPKPTVTVNKLDSLSK